MFVRSAQKNILRYLLASVVLLGMLSFLVASASAAVGINKVINFQGKVTNSNGTNVADGLYDFTIKFYDGASSGASNSYTETWSSAALWASTMSSAPSSGGESLTYVTGTNESTIKVGQVLWNTTKEESVIVTSIDTGTNVIGISPTRQAWANGDTVTNKIYVKDGTFKVAINSLNQDLSAVNFNTDNVFLGINFNADGEMKPRIQYTAAPYAFNAEKVNGLTVTNTSNNPFSSTTILKINDGKTVIFNNTLTFSGTDSTTFTLPSGSGTVVTLDSTGSLTNKSIGSTGLTFSGATTDVTTGTNEDLVITPNGTGKIALGTFATGPFGYLDVRSPLGTSPAASISAQSSFAALIADNRGLGDIFTASSSGLSRFTVQQNGVVQVGAGAAGLEVPGYLGLGVKSSTGDPVGGFEGAMYYNTFDNKFRCYQGSAWTDCIGAGGSSAWSSLAVPSTDLSLAMSTNRTTFNWATGTSTNNLFSLTSDNSANGTGALVNIQTGTSSTILPLRVRAGATEAIYVKADGNVGIRNTSPGQELDVDGDILIGANSIFDTRASGTLTIAGTTATTLSLGRSGQGITLPGFTGNNAVLFATTGTGVLAAATTSSTGQCLTSGASATYLPTWGSCGSGTSQWTTTGNDIYYTTGNVGIGSTLPSGRFNVTGKATGKALAILNESGDQDIFTASASGITQFTLKQDGTLVLGRDDISTPTQSTLRAGNGVGTDAVGANLIIQGGNGTGVGGSGFISFQTAVGASTQTITRDAISSSATNPDASTLAWSHVTTSSTNRIMIVGISTRGNTVVNSVTYGSQNLTKIRNDNPGGDIRTEIWYLIAPNAGTATITVTAASTATMEAGAVTFTGVGQTIATALGSDNGATSATGHPTVNVTSATGEVVVDVAGTQSSGAFLTEGGGQISNWNEVGTGANAGSSYESGSGTTTMSWTSSDTNQPWAVSAIAIKPGGGSSADALTDRLRITPDGNIGIGTTAPRAKLDVQSLSGTAPIASMSGNTSFAGLVIDNAGSGDLLTASVSGVTRFTVGNQGGITINSGSSDIHKSTAGNNTKDTDFIRTANSTSSTLTNVSSSNNSIGLDSGTVPNSGTGTITTGSQPALAAALGEGASSILRQDGKYLVLRGAATTTLYIYDTIANTFSTSAQTLNNAAGAGAIALPRSDGRYRVVHGGSATTTSLVDPMGAVAVGASSAIGTAPTVSSTVAYRRQNGRYFIAIGGTTATSVYNPSPTTETFSAGPSANTTGLGALLLPRPDGGALLINGGATATTQVYNPNNGTITNGAPIGSLSSGTALPAGCEINNLGSVAIQLPNWRYIILSKANVSVEYDAVTNTMGACQGVGPATAMGGGGHAVRLQNRKILIFPGGNATAAYIYDPTANTYTAHGTATTAVGIGGHTVQKHDGTFQLLAGNSTTTNNIDTGLVMGGSYISEDFNTTNFNINSSILWSQGAENIFIGTSSAMTNTPQSNVEVLVRTATSQGGLSSALDKPIQKSGDLISAGSSDQWARVTINMRRPLPQNIVDERFTFFGNGTTLYLRDYAGPTIYDYTIDNSTVLRRTAFNFVNSQLSTASHEASTSSLLRVQALADRLTLPQGVVPGDAMVGTTGTYQGLIGPHPIALTSTGEGTIVMSLPDGQFGVIATASAAVNYSIYDPASSTFIRQSGAGDVPTTYPGWGSFAIKLPDGRFLIVFGESVAGAVRTTTNIYDPRAASGSRFIAGPALSVGAGRGALPIKNTDGTYTILHGNAATTTSLFNPFTDLNGLATFPAGPTMTLGVTCGSLALPLAGTYANQYRVFTGTAQFTTATTTNNNMIYDAVRKQFVTGPNLGAGTNTGCGSIAFQRQDGMWVYTQGAGGTNGAQTTTLGILNPFINAVGAGAAMTSGVGRGSVAIPRADGTWLITRGQTQTIDGTSAANGTTNIYSPFGGTMIAVLGVVPGTNITTGPTIVSNHGAGAVTFQRPDGKWVIINGGMAGSNNVQLVDTGWYADGQYLSGQMYVPQLSASSALTYKSLPDNYLNFEIRTAASRQALMTADYRSIYPADATLGASSSDKWMQVQINFSRQFPSYSDVYQDVWLGRGAYAWRNISQPTLFEYKVTNDANLLTLQSDGQNVFRVSGSGSVYSGQQGGFFAGGADLAERYSSQQTLEAAEVVVADPYNPQGVVRSSNAYQGTLLGVVSTDPGFVAGAYTENSYPIALVGRVPVKVSIENGSIKTGDYLTSATVPGHAMRATQAGRVIGKALEDLDESKLSACALPGADQTAKCGTIMLFVNLTDYHGDPIEVAMGERSTQSVQGLEENIRTTGISSVGWMRIGKTTPTDEQAGVLSFLKDLKNTKPVPTSQLFTDRVSAAFDIISPTIITDTLYAHTIKADRIEGLEIYTDKIGSLSEELRNFLAQNNVSKTSVLGDAAESSQSAQEDLGQAIDASASSLLTNTTFTGLEGLSIKSATISSDLRVKGNGLVEGILSVIDTIVTKNILVSGTMNVLGDVFFKGTTNFEGHTVYSKDAAGFAVIKKGAKRVEIRFAEEYTSAPIISATVIASDVMLDNGKKEDPEVTQRRLFDLNVKYLIANRTEKGFTLVLDNDAPEDLTFSWMAISVKEASMSVGDKEASHQVLSTESVPSDAMVDKFIKTLLSQ